MSLPAGTGALMFKMEITTSSPPAEWSALFEQLKDLDTKYAGVELIGRRADGVDYTKLMQGLIDTGRDFFSADQPVADAVAQAMATAIEDSVAGLAKKGRTATDDQLALKGLKAAMEEYMAQVVKRIENQTVADGGGPEPLSPAYAKYKERKFGFTTPIGKATGQLLQSLAPGGAAAGKIQYIRK